MNLASSCPTLAGDSFMSSSNQELRFINCWRDWEAFRTKHLNVLVGVLIVRKEFNASQCSQDWHNFSLAE